MLAAVKDQRGAAGAWLIGGLPLVWSSLQAISALMGNTTLYWIPFIGEFAEALSSLTVVLEAARIFYGQATIVLALFLLITLAWLAQGILMFSTAGREKSYSKVGSAGAVVMSGLLYGFLFLGIYSALLGRTIAIAQVAGFFLIPVVATGALGAAFRTYSWEDQRRAQAVSRIKSAERTVKNQRRSLDRSLENLPLGEVESISPGVVRGATDAKEEFYRTCDSISEDAEATLDNASKMEASELENESHAIERRAAALDADTVEADVESRLWDALEDVVDERFSGIQREFTSRYGERYRTANLPEDRRTVDVPGTDELILISTASQGGIAGQLHNVFDHNDIPLDESIALLATVDSKINDEVLPYLEEYEDDFREIEETVEKNLDSATEKIDDIGGHTGTTLERILVRGTTDDGTASAPDVPERLDEARRNLHACKLEEAIEGAAEAEAMTEEYMESVRFVRSALIPAIKRGKDSVSSVPHPDSREYDFFTTSMIENLEEPLKNDHGAAIELDLDQRNIRIEHGVESASDEEIPRDPPANTGPRDEVKYLIRKIQADAGEGDVPSETTIGVESLPSAVTKADPLPEFIDFVKSIDTLKLKEYPTEMGNGGSQSVQDPGYVSLKATGGEPIERATDDLLDEYGAWASRTGGA